MLVVGCSRRFFHLDRCLEDLRSRNGAGFAGCCHNCFAGLVRMASRPLPGIRESPNNCRDCVVCRLSAHDVRNSRKHRKRNRTDQAGNDGIDHWSDLPSFLLGGCQCQDGLAIHPEEIRDAGVEIPESARRVSIRNVIPEILNGKRVFSRRRNS